MKIVINIPEKTYKELTKYDEFIPSGNRLYDSALSSIYNGTPLPKGHGNLKDMDALYENTEIGHDEDGYACVTWKAINDAPTTIEADKG